MDILHLDIARWRLACIRPRRLRLKLAVTLWLMATAPCQNKSCLQGGRAMFVCVLQPDVSYVPDCFSD